MGRTNKRETFDSLKECLALAESQPRSNIPYEVSVLDKKIYVWASSAANAMKSAIYHLGPKASPVPVGEILDTAKKE